MGGTDTTPSRSAQATSAASASLSFTILGGAGFAWLTTPASTADSSARATPLEGIESIAGVFAPAYGAAVVRDNLVIGTAVPASSASATAGDVFGSAFSFGNPASATLQASSLVPTAGMAEATSFARSWFSLGAGASVTFQGALLLALTGTNPAFPPNHRTGDFYSFASGLLAVGSNESNWPGNGGYGPGGASARPRSATVVITRNDSGVVGYDPTLRMAVKG